MGEAFVFSDKLSAIGRSTRRQPAGEGDVVDPIGVAISLAAGVVGYVYFNHRQMMEGPDGDVLKQLKAAGSDLKAPHEVDFFFVGLGQAALEAIGAELRSLGYEITLRSSEESNDAVLTARTMLVPTIRTMLRLRREHTRRASAAGCIYDGWGASVVAAG